MRIAPTLLASLILASVPSHSLASVFRSLLLQGETRGLPDGVDADDGHHSDAHFPFLAPPRRNQAD